MEDKVKLECREVQKEENYQEDIQQKYCMDRIIRSSKMNI